MLSIPFLCLWSSFSLSSGYDLQFPPWFKFGAATSAYQTEGAWNVSDKGEGKWDRLTHKYPELITDRSNGDDATNSYYLWKRDLEMVEELGLHFYRFSINWPRVLPTGFANKISEDGKNFYDNMINGLLARGIEPMVSMYHWEMPQLLRDLGGWANPKSPDWFADYARVLYNLYGDRVKTWITINEPVSECDFYYGRGVLEPQLDYYIAPYLCNKNILLAHAKAWRIYDEEFRYKHNGKVSIANNLMWIMPYSEKDEQLAEMARHFNTGRYAHAIFSKEGGWPPYVEEIIAERSRQLGFNESRLPAFTRHEIEFIRGTYDFFAINYYSTKLARPPMPWDSGEKTFINYIFGLEAALDVDPHWQFSENPSLPVYPEGLRKLLHWLRQQYGDLEFFITENGYGSRGSNLNDNIRVSFIRRHLEQISLAIQEGINVSAYTYWSLMDNFEWSDGYQTKYGLYEVDFSDHLRKRTPRKSAIYFANIVKRHSFAVLAGAWSTQDLSFPPGFIFGAATASYQVEGAWNEGGKSENTWDRYVHEDPTRIKDLTNGDVACDSYHQWKRDIEMAEELGLHFYRFSLSWSRILPSGFPNIINEEGKNYYNNLIDGLLEKGIQPMVTIYHWDLPQSLQDLGGWANPLIVDWFVDYARVAYTLFGDRVKVWITINEPVVFCDGVYNSGRFAPLIYSPEVGAYLCNKYALLAHAKAWRLYDQEFKPKYHGKVSLANQMVWFEPYDSTEEHIELAELARQNSNGRYAHPIYSKAGGWPPSIEKVLEEVSLKRGYSKSSLPAFTQEEIELMRGTYDYFAMNYYTTRLIRKAREGEQFTAWPLGDCIDLNAIIEKREDWPTAQSYWFYVFPEGFRRQLNWMKQQYGDMEIIITENGISTVGGLDDQERIQYYRDHLEQILLAVKEDGLNVTGYCAWTLMDNFEWGDGLAVKFGLYEVDFSDPMRKRIPRASARYYSDIISSHSLDIPTDYSGYKDTKKVQVV
ncbi:lactase/phlorizin hydrolase [Helicoverpa armigera]|uniref:lactase/phlorizin hydrolase n=1 Tax=Helicoverpa armigera TaxID=29058 RepID=UPI003082DF8B